MKKITRPAPKKPEEPVVRPIIWLEPAKAQSEEPKKKRANKK